MPYTRYPLAYLGVKAANPPNVIQSSRIPRTSDYDYDLGTIWIATSLDTAYVLVDVTSGSASWESIGGVESAPATFGTSSVPLTAEDDAFSTDSNVVQVYASSTGGTDATDYTAITGDLSITTGDGTDIPNGISGTLTTESGSDILQAAGIYGHLPQSV